MGDILETNERNRLIALDYVKNCPGIKSHQLAAKRGWNPKYARNMLNWLARRGEAVYTWHSSAKSWYPVRNEFR
jgi:hypothetical protein